MRTTHYSLAYLQSKITATKSSHLSGKSYLFSMHYRRRLVCWRTDASLLYDSVTDSDFASSYPSACKDAYNYIYGRLVDKYYETLPSQLLSL